MMSDPFAYPGHSPLSFANQNEDYRVEMAALAHVEARARPLRCLTIASSGDTTLALASFPTDKIASIDACDVNPVQIHLTELRRCAVLHLGMAELRALFAVVASDEERVAGAAAREAAYAAVRASLPEATRAFWDGPGAPLIAFGTMFAGNNERLNAGLRSALRAEGIEFEVDLRAAMREEAFRRVFTAQFGAENTMKVFFGDLERARRVDWSWLRPERLLSHIEGAVDRGLDLSRSYFTSHMLRGTFLRPSGDDDDALPLAYTSAGQAAIRAHGAGADRLRLHTGDALATVAAAGPFDFITLSNIADWLPAEALGPLLERVWAGLAPGGAVLLRQTCDRGYDLADRLAQAGFHVDPAVNAALAAAERAPMMAGHVLGVRTATREPGR